MWPFRKQKPKQSSDELYRVKTYADFDSRRIITEVNVCNDYTDMIFNVRGLWDTGGKVSTISRNLVERLNLSADPSMSMRVHTSSGVHYSKVYPIKLLFDDAEVKCYATSCERILDDVDIIIGMDVIIKGDFSITNVNGHTEMIFRIPPQGHIRE